MDIVMFAVFIVALFLTNYYLKYIYIYIYIYVRQPGGLCWKNCAEVLSTALKTEGTVFSNTDRPRLVKTFSFFSINLTKFLPKEPNDLRL